MRVLRAFGNGLFFIVFCVLLLLYYSERWFLSVWDSTVEFSTVVYQLFSPLKGTGGQIVNSYMKACIFPALAVLVLFCVAVFLIGRNVFFWEIRIGGRGVSFSLETRCVKAFSGLFLLAVLCMLCRSIWAQAVEIGVVEYYEATTKRSAIFEEEYVHPGEAGLSFPEKKRNLILIYLESMETTYASKEVGGGKPTNYIPELTQLAYDNLFFSNDDSFGGGSSVYGAGWTMAALLASSTGVPYKLGIEGNTADEYEKFLPGIVSLGDVLKENGYHNYFLCGSDISFAGRKDFYQQHGDYTLLDLFTAQKEGIVPDGYNNGFWGMEDERLFAYARERLPGIAAGGEPFNVTLLTVDTHHADGYVCGLCEEQYPQQFANALACSSRQTAEFVEWIQQQDWYEDTTVVIMGDHLSMKADFWDDIGEYDRKIYNCFINIAEGLGPARTADRIFTAFDLFPTILAAMGADMEQHRLGLGVNLFSGEATLPERMGLEQFNYEIGLYSQYYFRQFIASD